MTPVNFLGGRVIIKHLIDKVPVSQIADEMKVQPTLIHNCVNTAMAQVERAFESPGAP